MAVNLSPYGGVGAQFFTNNGVPLAGGKIFTYAAGTTTPQATYTSANGATAHANPIILDAAGRVPGGEIWLTDGLQYKFVLKDSNDITLATYDNVVGINSNFINYTNEQEIQTATAGQTVFTLTTMQYQPGTGSLSVFVDGVNQYGPGAQYAFVETDSTTVTFVTGLHVGASVKFTTAAINAASYGDAFQISYTPPFTGAAATNVGDKLAQTVSVKDFGAVGDGVADDTVAMAAAHATGRTIYYPSGTYLFTKLTTPITRGGIVGDGPTSTVLHSTDTSNDALMIFDGLWLNSAPQEDNNAFVFRDFGVQATTGKTLGACIEVTAPIVASVQQENQITVFDNVTCRNFATGIYFKSASFWKVLNCNFIEYRVAGIQVANIYNSDSGDGMITNCLFETNPVSAGNAGILQNSSGGLKITGCKFLGASFGYKMAWTGAASSNLQIVNNSFELMDTFAISLTRSSGTATFSLINITGNNFALSGFHIGTDSNTWLSKIAVTGNIFELWGGYASVLNSIGLNNVNNLIISGNTFIGAGVTSVAISLVNPTNGQVGLNNYYGITIPVDQSGAVNVPVALTEQYGSAVTSSTGWTTYGSALFISTVTNVTFDAPYSIAPDPNNVQLTAGDGSGTVAGIVASVTTTGFSFQALNVYNDRASTIYWSVKGYI